MIVYLTSTPNGKVGCEACKFLNDHAACLDPKHAACLAHPLLYWADAGSLEELPSGHALRNTPLVGFRYTMPGRMIKTNTVSPSFGIADKTYNQLGEVWTKHHVWLPPKTDNE